MLHKMHLFDYYSDDVECFHLSLRTHVKHFSLVIVSLLCWQSNISSFEYAIYGGHNFPSKECLLISWLQSPSAMILEPMKTKSDTVSPSFSHEVMGPDAMILVFWMLSFKPTFSLKSTVPQF